jgi:imidazole glycerol-phosphate synthase subunit HisH
MITIIDYGVGNIKAFVNIYKQLNIPVSIAKDKEELATANKLILPGVGNFDYTMQRFNDSGLRDEVSYLVLEKKIPILGVCVGMQMLAKSSEEGQLEGLNWVSGHVAKFDAAQVTTQLPLPHMGWNDVNPVSYNPLLANIDEKPKFYFLHSYYFKCDNADDSIATADYGTHFTCAVNHNNIYGTQFHPEKSHRFGIQLLKNFAEKC